MGLARAVTVVAAAAGVAEAGVEVVVGVAAVKLAGEVMAEAGVVGAAMAGVEGAVADPDAFIALSWK